MPVRWDELKADLRGARFNVRNVPQRLACLDTDPWQNFAAARRVLAPALLEKIVS
jgi:DNA primase